MQPNELLEELKKLSESQLVKKQGNLLKNLPKELCNLTVKSESNLTSKQVRGQVEKFAPEQGWLCFQSEVQYFPQPGENTENAEKVEKQIPPVEKTNFWTKFGFLASLWHFFIPKRQIPPSDSTPPFQMPSSDILLNGEVTNAKGQSLHIREDGQGTWILTYFTETEGDEYLVETKSFLGENEIAPEKLYYRVYWQYDEKQGSYRQIAARFTGFKEK